MGTLTVEWAYTPPDFFEEPRKVSDTAYTLEIKDGKATAALPPDISDQEVKVLIGSIGERLWRLFVGRQLDSNKRFELSRSYSATRTRPDGTGDLSVFPEPAVAKTEAVNPDIVIRDAEGNVITDTRRDRNEACKKSEMLSMKHGEDTVAASLLKSYNSAINDPDNELTHLYEIRDALEKKFHGKKNACDTLAIHAEWNRLKRLANDEPLLGGRHQGGYVGRLRHATPSELEEARQIAGQMIHAYLSYLERSSSTP